MRLYNLFVTPYFHFFRSKSLEKIEKDDISVSIKIEKISGKLMIHVPYSHVLAVHEVIMRINWLKGICFPKMREIVELILCQTSGAIPVICMRKESFVFSINL